MEQLLTFHLAINGQSLPSHLHAKRVVGRPSDRIYVPPAAEMRSARTAAKPAPSSDARPIIRLQPIVSKPLQPYVLRETACDFLECRSSGRRCIASNGREVDLGYQVAYCLGARHRSCPVHAGATKTGRVYRARKAIYTAVAFIMIGLIVAAVIQALGPGAPVELGRAVGLG